MNVIARRNEAISCSKHRVCYAVIGCILFFVGSSCSSSKKIYSENTYEYEENLFDAERSRVVPVAVYHKGNELKKSKVVVLNHGYGQNKGGDYKIYSHIAKKLAQHGYFVISIQHELPTDDLLAMEGDLRITRMPNWERGVQNISFVMDEFKKLKPGLDWDHTSLIGHSNGGDMVMLFATKYPQQVTKAISLDNRRMPLPRTSKPGIYSLRACDYPADEGVIPSPEEQKKFHIQVVMLDDVKHSEMDDDASESQSIKINNYLLHFLKE